MGVAPGVGVAGVRIGHVDAAHTGLGQDEQFACIGAAVGVGVFPDAQLGKGNILSVNHAIGVGVECVECLEAVGGFGAVGQQGLGAEEFAAGVDAAVAIEVAHEQAVVGAGPAGAFGKAVGGVVEPCAVCH
ncbi:hypothetical protein FQZ97_1156550 [compost metagenome]